MTVAERQRKWTVEEFFAWNEVQEEKYELIDGLPLLKRVPVPVLLEGNTAPTMMTGANRRHNRTTGNLLRLVGNQLRGGPCNAFANDAAVRTGTSQIRFPDLLVDCGTPLDDGFEFEHPRLVAEVLSPSTRSFDLARKITEYWQVASITSVLIVDSDTLRVQLHRRGSDDVPTVRVYADADDVIDVPDLGITLKLADIFEGLAPASDP